MLVFEFSRMLSLSRLELISLLFFSAVYLFSILFQCIVQSPTRSHKVRQPVFTSWWTWSNSPRWPQQLTWWVPPSGDFHGPWLAGGPCRQLAPITVSQPFTPVGEWIISTSTFGKWNIFYIFSAVCAWGQVLCTCLNNYILKYILESRLLAPAHCCKWHVSHCCRL